MAARSGRRSDAAEFGRVILIPPAPQFREKNEHKKRRPEQAQDAFGSPPPELPNYVLIVCPLGPGVNITSVMPDLHPSTFGRARNGNHARVTN